MKSTRIYVLGQAIVAASAISGCGFNPQTPKTQSADISGLENAYISDAMVADASDDSFDGDIDDNVKVSIAEDRLDSMANKMLTELDNDKSGTISGEEFLNGARRHYKAEHGTEMDAEKEHHLSEKFSSAAGDDKVLNKEELKVFLKNRAKAVHHRRHRDDDNKNQNANGHKKVDDSPQSTTRSDDHGQATVGHAGGSRMGEVENHREGQHGGRFRGERGHF